MRPTSAPLKDMHPWQRHLAGTRTWLQVVATVSEFLKNTSMASMPLYAQGYSSGGTMLLKLPAYLKSKCALGGGGGGGRVCMLV